MTPTRIAAADIPSGTVTGLGNYAVGNLSLPGES